MTKRIIAEAFPPGEFIKEELEARNWSQIDLADIIGRQPNVVNEIIMGKRSITPETAKALGEAFGTSAQLWMNLESSYQLWKSKATDTGNAIARRARLYGLAPIKEMARRHWLEPSENIEVLEKQIKHFFEIDDLDQPIQLEHAARRGTETITPAQMAWIYRAKQLALGVHAKPFSDKSFIDGLSQVKKLLHSLPEIRHVPRILSDAGIRFLVIEHLPQTRIDGVTFWLDNKSPVIVLSLRYDRIDGFWYTIAHELAHVKRKDGFQRRGVILDTDLVGNETRDLVQESEAEMEADFLATEFLVGHAELDDFIARKRPLYSQKKIVDFANRIQVHPGIVVGQLQFRKEIPWSSFRPMLDKVRHIITQSALTDGWGHLAPILKQKEKGNGYDH